MIFHDFESQYLKNYRFSWGQSYGYDRQGNLWQEENFEFTQKKNEGKIIKEYREKIVFYDKGLIGRLRESWDKTWMAHSPYNDPVGDLEVFGFTNEFYAVRYLHQISLSIFPNPTEIIPDLPLS